MKLNIHTVILLIFMTSLLTCSANSQVLDSVSVYCIINDELNPVLDSFIIHEKQYEYYNKDVTFFVNVMDSIGVVFELNSGTLFKEIPFLYSYKKKNAGIFIYKGHTFILSGRSIISNKIMVKTCNYQTIKFIDVKDVGNNAIEDDSFFPTTWLCKFDKDSMLILSKTPMIKYK